MGNRLGRDIYVEMYESEDPIRTIQDPYPAEVIDYDFECIVLDDEVETLTIPSDLSELMPNKNFTNQACKGATELFFKKDGVRVENKKIPIAQRVCSKCVEFELCDEEGEKQKAGIWAGVDRGTSKRLQQKQRETMIKLRSKAKK